MIMRFVNFRRALRASWPSLCPHTAEPRPHSPLIHLIVMGMNRHTKNSSMTELITYSSLMCLASIDSFIECDTTIKCTCA